MSAVILPAPCILFSMHAITQYIVSAKAVSEISLPVAFIDCTCALPQLSSFAWRKDKTEELDAYLIVLAVNVLLLKSLGLPEDEKKRCGDTGTNELIKNATGEFVTNVGIHHTSSQLYAFSSLVPAQQDCNSYREDPLPNRQSCTY